MKATTSRWIIIVLSIIAPLLYLSMYCPIWNGKELYLAKSGTFGIILFIFQCICLVFAIVHLCFTKLRNSDSCLLTPVTMFLFIASLTLTCFYGFFFMLELFNIPWFPPQQ